MAQGKRLNPEFADKGVFTGPEADIRAVVVRWDALEGRPVMHLGGVSPHEAYAWLQQAADVAWSMTSDAGCGVEED